jgi:hypothetical protein
MSDEDGLQLSPQLMQDMRDALKKHDARCSDDMLAMQYLVAAAGMMLSSYDNAGMNKHDALHDLSGFMHHVYDYMEKEKVKRAAPPPQDAMGVWKPGK